MSMDTKTSYALFADTRTQLAAEQINNNNLQADDAIAGQNVATATDTVNSTQRELNSEKNTLTQYQDLLKMTAANTPLKKMYSGIKEFQIQNKGMCGMGMGMGEFVDSCMQLTGQELLDISNLLKENKDGKFKPSELAEKLNSLEGRDYKATADDSALGSDGNAGNKAALTITRSDGSKVEFKDANGDGQLNSCDYNFDEALAKFQADMAQWEKDMQAAQDKVDAQQKVVDDLTAEQNKNKSDLETAKKEKTDTEGDLNDSNQKLGELETLVHELQSARTEDKTTIATESGKKTRSEAFDALLERIDSKDYDDTTFDKAMEMVSDALAQSYHNQQLDGTSIDDLIEPYDLDEQKLADFAQAHGRTYTPKKRTSF